MPAIIDIQQKYGDECRRIAFRRMLRLLAQFAHVVRYASAIGRFSLSAHHCAATLFFDAAKCRCSQMMPPGGSLSFRALSSLPLCWLRISSPDISAIAFEVRLLRRKLRHSLRFILLHVDAPA